jgi:hypothetical protein
MALAVAQSGLENTMRNRRHPGKGSNTIFPPDTIFLPRRVTLAHEIRQLWVTIIV